MDVYLPSLNSSTERLVTRHHSPNATWRIARSNLTGSVMECWTMGSVRCFPHKLKCQESKAICCNASSVPLLKETKSVAFRRHASMYHVLGSCVVWRSYPKWQLYWRKQKPWRTFVSPISLDAEPKEVPMRSEGEFISDEPSERPNSPLMRPDELKALLVDSERTRLVKTLSEANQHNRYLKRQLQIKDDDLVNLKSNLSILEGELQALVGLAEELVSSQIMLGKRNINAEYIHSYLLSRLEGFSEKLKQQIKGVDLIKFQEVTLSWIGMAKSVQVMGTFDGWSRGVDMSPEYDGFSTMFSTTLKLRPGRYEIKYLVDEVWHLSPELPTVGEGFMENNLLVVS